MLPNNTGLSEILFPMSAEIYYAQTNQAEYGNVVKNWVFAKSVKCSAISEMSNNSLDGELKTKGGDFIYDSSLYFRTPDDIREDGTGKYYPITAIAITEIKDPNGEYVWINGQNKKISAEPVSTKYEVKTIVPTFDYDHNLRHWRVYLSKSQSQRWQQ